MRGIASKPNKIFVRCLHHPKHHRLIRALEEIIRPFSRPASAGGIQKATATRHVFPITVRGHPRPQSSDLPTTSTPPPTSSPTPEDLMAGSNSG
uniref:Uncharacterized protein n=1 Tax=Arundo donax TaxID=35708 RepID=A0A0A9EYW5_ARUDO